ncbi:MAG TPA: hypothetical protein G4O18_03510 [Dehalococcoidia bacterium]|nr:hypothetical protein [Dehalococcoidia bacterium]
MQNRQLNLQIPVNTVVKAIVIILALLLVANIVVIIVGHTTGHYSLYGVLPLFRLDQEHNVPTYFATVILLVSSVLLYTIFRIHKRDNLSDSKYWRLLSLIFLLLSLDEAAGLHELLIRPLKDLLGIDEPSLFYFAWVIPGIIICVVFALYFFRFYLSLPSRYRLLFGISALVFVGGFLGMEIVDGFFAPTMGERTLLYDILTTIEEFMELSGIALFIYSLLDYIKSRGDTISVSLSGQ